MGVFVVVATRLGVVAPRLRNPQIDLVLGVVNAIEVVRNARLDEVAQFGQGTVTKDRVVLGGDIAHVRASLLALDEVNLFVGQITV